MNVLITGATGLIGTSIKEYLSKEPCFVICQSREYRPDENEIKWVKNNLISDSWDCLDQYDVDIVFYLAGQTSVHFARENPCEDISGNVIALIRLIEYFRSKDKKPFIVLAGTATEVGLTKKLPINEKLYDKPITFYDLSKLMAEKYLRQYVREGLANGCTLRLANVYGRGMVNQKKDRGILDKVYKRAYEEGKVTIYGNGNYLRDYIFIDDVVSAFIHAAKHRNKINGSTFYIGSGEGVKLKEAFIKVATLATNANHSKLEVEYVEPPKNLPSIDLRNAMIDYSAFSDATGWNPKYQFDTGIKIAYTKKTFALNKND